MGQIQSDGASEDIIRSFVQLSCGEMHLKTLIEKTESELENGIVNIEDEAEFENATKKLTDLSEELDMVTELRRSAMLKLFEMYDGDKDYWCMVKHLGGAAYTLFEAYQANGDPETYNLALEANKCFVRALTHFLGTEITDCISCLADFLKAKENKDA